MARVPDGVVRERGWRITDRYIRRTRLRLRRMEPIDGGDALLKFGQKHVPSPPDFARMTMTNLYLSPEEYAVLAVLPALELRKRRHPFEEGGRTYGIDVFAGLLSGLVLAEVGFETDEDLEQRFVPPAWIVREVSNDVRFTGGALAALTSAEAAALLGEVVTEQSRA